LDFGIGEQLTDCGCGEVGQKCDGREETEDGAGEG
jgi:hypothetical protein